MLDHSGRNDDKDVCIVSTHRYLYSIGVSTCLNIRTVQTSSSSSCFFFGCFRGFFFPPIKGNMCLSLPSDVQCVVNKINALVNLR